ncbi:MAG: FAD-dependent oxidoreductase [Betaproteobacteria bacterium]|nr:FAD-dependent oxidoreductase [Betaproteobacteria bacterium]
MAKRVVLAGGGHAHLAVLADWARRPMPDTERLLVTSSRHTAYSGMFPGWLAGLYHAKDLFIDLAPLAEQAGARMILADVTGMDADAATISLSNGRHVEYDLVSLATGGETDVSNLAALGEKLIPAKPVDAFMERWKAFLHAIALKSVVEVAVVGGGAAGVELAMAISVSLRRHFTPARVSLVAADGSILAGHSMAVQRLALDALRDREITVHYATAVGTDSGLLLSDGTELKLDCVVAATGSRAPSWLARSTLSCTREGYVEVGADLRSRSHCNAFAAGDLIERIDRKVERSGVHAVKAGPVLAANLSAALQDAPMQAYNPRQRTLYLLSTADRRAILSWGKLAVAGAWAWKLKDWIDRNFVEQQRLQEGLEAPWQGKGEY